MKNYDKILQYALGIISKKRYTLAEMHNKLTRYIECQESFDDDKVDPVLERLLELDYLNDEKFARDYISDRIKLKPRGRLLIERELVKKGISKTIIDSTFDNINFNEVEIAKDVLFRKISNWNNFPREKQKEKAYRFLNSRGFNGEAIYKTIESCYS